MSPLFIQLFKEVKGNLTASVEQDMSGNMIHAVSFPTPCLDAEKLLKQFSEKQKDLVDPFSPRMDHLG